MGAGLFAPFCAPFALFCGLRFSALTLLSLSTDLVPVEPLLDAMEGVIADFAVVAHVHDRAPLRFDHACA